MFVIVRSLRRRQINILDVGESSLDVGEQTVGEMTRRRNDRNLYNQVNILLCRSTFCERDMMSNCVKHKPDAGGW